MKLRILSDLHLEYHGFNPPAADADAVILAGDIGSAGEGFAWAAHHFVDAGIPVIYVPGNHEYYGFDMQNWTERARDAAEVFGVIFGDENSLLLQKAGEAPVRILGATLWTDFKLFGTHQQVRCGELTEKALAKADYAKIQHEGRLLRWQDTLALHERQLAWFKRECGKANAAGEKVVMAGHHAPSFDCIGPQYKNDPSSAGFASNLDGFLAEHVDLAVHGHVHHSVDFRRGRCRVVANPRGYPLQRWNPNTPFENPKFNPVLVIEV